MQVTTNRRLTRPPAADMNTICLARPSRRPLTASILGLLAVAVLPWPRAQATEQFWRTDGTGGTWTGTNWSAAATLTGGTAYGTNNDAHFTALSTVTFATAAIGNVTVDANQTVTITQAGTATFGASGAGGLVRTFDIGSGALLTWKSQTITANSTAGLIKNGTGTLDLGALTSTTMSGGFTLNAGKLITTGDKAEGTGALTLNGGTLESTGTRAFTPTSITVGGDFALSGTGNANWDAATTIALGASTRTITNSTTSGSRQFRGLISGSSGAGLTFAGSGAAQIFIGNTGNTFDGPVAITGGEVVFKDNGSFGNTSSITIDGGRLTMADMDTGGNTSPLTTATIASGRNIFVGATAGTSISIQSATGVTTYNGVIADKASTTGAWAKQGAGTLKLGGVSTYTGATAINNGTLQITTGNDRLPTGTVVSLGQSASANLGTLDLNGLNQQIAGLNSTAGTNATATNNTVTSAGAATLTLGGSGTYSYGDGTNGNSGVITGAISVIKQGSGTQTLGDTNPYTGTTTVTGGTLLVSGSLTGSITSAATVSNNGSTLGGSGTVGNVTVNTGAALQGGDGIAATGTLTSAGNISLTDGSQIKLTLGASAAHSSLTRTGGTWSFDSDQAFTFTLLGAQVGTYDNLISGLIGSETGLGSIGSWVITNPGVTGTFSYDGSGGVDLVITAVPEPSAFASVLLGTGLLMSYRRFRRTMRIGVEA